MALELKIENFGPIDAATIQVGRFTVFAGPNNTGKTFVAKMLYSMLGARKANHALVFFDMMTHSIELNLQRFEQIGRVVEERPWSAIRKRVQKIDSILRETFPSNPTQSELDRLRAVQSELMAEIEKIKVHYQTLKNSDKKEKEGPSSATHQFENFISTLEHGFKNVEWMINWGRSQKLHQNIRGNFQESDLSNIKGDGDSPLYFSIEGVGELRGTEKSFAFNLYPQIVQKMPSFPEAFYLESPLYWKLKSALESIKLDSRSPFTALNGVPDYFYDMAVALRRRRIEHPFAGIHESLHKAIGGQILLSEAGDLEFQKEGKSISLSLTSAGVANMGMLALLIERGALERGSFLFIDEPESNLHPAWQVEMAAFLFELARQGVNVVVSTHSMTILKWLEVHVKEKPEDRELVRLNKFPPDAEWNDDMDAVMAEVKQSLTKPFSDLYIKGL
jgi:energy-coupling factor transporter ATP-binding protein EcfA2